MQTSAALIALPYIAGFATAAAVLPLLVLLIADIWNGGL